MKRRFTKSLNAIIAFIALFIIADFLIPGKVYQEEISEIKRERQQYYNAARNHHNSSLLITAQHQFNVSEEFAGTVKVKEVVEYSISRIFHEVNWHRPADSTGESVYSLRIVSGLVIPLLGLISMGLAFRYKEKFDTLVFVIQGLLIADLVYVIW